MFRLLAVLAVLAVPGCGRLGFDRNVDVSSDARPICTTSFGAPAQIPGTNINTAQAERGPVVSADGLELFFYSPRPGGLGGSDVWYATRTSPAEPFGPAAPLANVNTSNEDGGQSLTADGLMLFFSSSRPGGFGANDVWVATRPDRASPFGPPVHVPEASSPAAEYDPIISPDGLVLYVSSMRAGGLGGFDLWRLTRSSTNAAFGAPVALSEINSSRDDNGGGVTADGRSIFFSTTRGDGVQADIWWASRVDPEAPFANPSIVEGINTGSFELGPSISAAGDTLYFSSERLGSSDLWFATRDCP